MSASGDAEGEQDEDVDETPTLADRIRGLRERVQRRETSLRASRRARDRRVRREEPESARDTAELKRRRLNEAREELGGLVGDTRDVVSTARGSGGRDDAAAMADEGAEMAEAAESDGDGLLTRLIDTDGDGAVDVLQSFDGRDIDGDGDVDVLEPVEAVPVSQTNEQRGGGRGGLPPAGGVEAELGVDGSGIEDELGLDDLFGSGGR